jgi:hypothetical protein
MVRKMSGCVIIAATVQPFVFMLMMFSGSRVSRCANYRWVSNEDWKLRWSPGFVITVASVQNNARGKLIRVKQ